MSLLLGQGHAGWYAMSRFVRAGAAALLLVGAACTNTNEPIESISIEPASTTVPIAVTPGTGGFTVPVTITNTSSTTIYYSDRCGYNVEQSKLLGDEGPRRWVTAWSPICTLDLPVGGSLRPLDPGESVTVTIDTRGSGLGRSTAWDGNYRVKFNLYILLLGRPYPLPEEARVSTPFSVV